MTSLESAVWIPWPSCQDQRLIEAAFGGHKPGHRLEARSFEKRGEFLTQQAAVFVGEMLCLPALVDFRRNVKVYRVLRFVEPVPDLMNDPAGTLIPVEGRLLDARFLWHQPVIIANACDEYSARLQLVCYRSNCLGELSRGEVRKRVVEGCHDVEVIVRDLCETGHVGDVEGDRQVANLCFAHGSLDGGWA